MADIGYLAALLVTGISFFNDPNIFKAFFLAGGPGSGKSFVTNRAFGGSGLKTINSDNAFERSLKKNGLSLKMPEDEAEARDVIRARS